jgi:hypothetical protein
MDSSETQGPQHQIGGPGRTQPANAPSNSADLGTGRVVHTTSSGSARLAGRGDGAPAAPTDRPTAGPRPEHDLPTAVKRLDRRSSLASGGETAIGASDRRTVTRNTRRRWRRNDRRDPPHYTDRHFRPLTCGFGAPGRTRTCNLRIRSKPRPVRLMLSWCIAAGRVGSAVQLVASRLLSLQRQDCQEDCQPHGWPRQNQAEPLGSTSAGLHPLVTGALGTLDRAGVLAQDFCDEGKQWRRINVLVRSPTCFW